MENIRPMVKIPGFDWRASLADRMTHYKLAGASVAVIDHGEIDWACGFGVRSQGSALKVDARTLFQAASISKAVTALGVLSLVDEGLVGLDVDVNKYLTSWRLPPNPDFPEAVVTLRQILSHTAGLTVHGFMGYEPKGPLPSLVDVLNGTAPAENEPVRIFARPGTICQYSGGGTVIATLLMSDVLGQDFPEIMRERVLGPAGMSDSFYAATLSNTEEDKIAAGHQGKALASKYLAYPELGPDALWSTPTDIAKFALAVCQAAKGDNVFPVSQALIQEYLTPQKNARFGDGFFGLGPIITGSGDQTRFGHSGYNAGYMCNFIQSVQGDNGVVVMTNGDQGYSLLNEIIYSVAETYQWEGYDRPSYSLHSLTPEELCEYLGDYEFISGGLQGGLNISTDGPSVLCDITSEILPKSQIVPIVRDRFAMMESPHQLVFKRGKQDEVETVSFCAEGIEVFTAKKRTEV